ncbi:MAG: signal peptide peptidase SppA [Candidatus Sumerlaeia bacterium]|nr:signal peptide peptidase SppA [Candidatus Sumerlaeia bacterium]
MKRIIVAVLLTAAATGCAVINVPLPGMRQERLREFVVQPARYFYTTDKILMLNLSGLISAEASSGLFTEQASTLADVRDALDRAERDSDIKALILRIDSPGGEVTASDAVYEQIRRFRKKCGEKKRPMPVQASILGTGTSGAYYVALAADKIFAHPTAVTGSIGVVATFPKLQGLTQKIGVEFQVIKSGEKKDLGSLWRTMTPEEQEIMQKMIGEMFDRFVELIAENRRGLDRERVRNLSDGRIYTARQALDLGLIDGIAYLDDVIESTKKAAGIKDAAVVTYRRASEFTGGIYSKGHFDAPEVLSQINLLQINAQGLLGPWRQPGFYYLWMP